MGGRQKPHPALAREGGARQQQRMPCNEMLGVFNSAYWHSQEFAAELGSTANLTARSTPFKLLRVKYGILWYYFLVTNWYHYLLMETEGSRTCITYSQERRANVITM
jgi:hypothetical protein